MIVVIVDDLLIATEAKEDADKLIEDIRNHYKIKNLGPAKYFIGMHLQYNMGKQLSINQQLYIENMGHRFGQDGCKPTKTQSDCNAKLRKDMQSPPTTKPYRSLVGSLIYATLTRPDIAVSVSQLSRYLEAPQESHWKAGIRVLRFLLTTKQRALILKVNTSELQTKLLTDSTWNSNPDNSRSRTGYAILFYGCLIIWKTKLQPHTTLSSTESKYVDLNDGAKEMLWAIRLLEEMCIKVQKPVPIFIDNQSAMALAKHKMTKPRTKHIALRYHWIREKVNDKTFEINYVPSKENLADLFTKILSQAQQAKLLKGKMSDLYNKANKGKGKILGKVDRAFLLVRCF